MFYVAQSGTEVKNRKKEREKTPTGYFCILAINCSSSMAHLLELTFAWMALVLDVAIEMLLFKH